MNYYPPSKADEANRCPKYEYCESKIGLFLQNLSNKIFLNNNKENYDPENFKKFVDDLKTEIDSSFKVDESNFKNSRRNFYINPWITPSIISSINKKHLYYKLWKKTRSKNNLDGNIDFYNRFKDYRKYLKKVIKVAKNRFYAKKFNNVKGDLKKTWALINELRGKLKQNIKASFVINGQIVEDRRTISNEFSNFLHQWQRDLIQKLIHQL